MDYYATLNDLGTYSGAEGAAFFSLNEQNEIRLYDLTKVIEHLTKTNQLDQFLIESELDDEIIADLDVDGPLTQVLIDGTREVLEI